MAIMSIIYNSRRAWSLLVRVPDQSSFEIYDGIRSNSSRETRSVARAHIDGNSSSRGALSETCIQFAVRPNIVEVPDQGRPADFGLFIEVLLPD